MELHYGILSTSSIAPRFIAALRAANAGNILALSSRSLEKAREKAAQWDIPVYYGSHRELLEDPRIHIVYISTVNSQHYPWAKAALEHGKHVVCEKPCTTTAAQTRELFALAREKNLFFMEAQKMFFLPTILEVRRRIEEGLLGQIHMVYMSTSFSAAYNTWLFDKEAGGGTLLSSGIYGAELIRWLFGPIRTIQGQKNALENGMEWQFIFSGTTESGVQFSCHNSTRAMLDNTARIFGSEGWVEIPEFWKARKAVFHLPGKEPEVVCFPCEHELMYEAQHIQQCLNDGLLTSPVVTEDISVDGIAALEALK